MNGPKGILYLHDNMNRMVTQNLQRQMDQKAKQENIIYDLEKHFDAKQKVHKMPNRGTILKPKSL